MAGKILLKPTDYKINNDGLVDYAYPIESLKDDIVGLSMLDSAGLVDECRKRWSDFSKFPLPTNYSKYKAAIDLAQELGIEVSLNVAKQPVKTDDKNIGAEREL